MKKDFFKISILVLLIASCNTTQKEQQENQKQEVVTPAEEILIIDTFKVYVTDTLFKSKISPCYTLSMNLPFYKTNTETAKAINHKINEVITQQTNIPLDSSLILYRDSLVQSITQELRETFDPDSEEANENLQYHYYIGGEFSAKPHKECIAYSMFFDIYSGGPHGTREIKYMNFNKKDGKFLTKGDVFDLTKEQELLDLILQKIMSDRNCKTIEELHNTTSITLIGDIYLGENFLLEEKGITFVYNTYEIASYADGTIFVFIPYEKLNEKQILSI